VSSVVCTVCKQWVRRRCSKLSESLNVLVGFKCSRCVEGTWPEEMKEMKMERWNMLASWGLSASFVNLGT
jgi:hypothetical protein